VGQFRTSLRKDSIANYASIWTLFTTSFTGPDVLCNALNISQILPVCIVLRGTMLLFLVFCALCFVSLVSWWIINNGRPPASTDGSGFPAAFHWYIY